MTRRLLAAFEACRAKEKAAADQLSKPRHTMLYPAYTRLLDFNGGSRGSPKSTLGEVEGGEEEGGLAR